MENNRSFVLRLISWWSKLRAALQWLIGGSIVAFILSNLAWEDYIKPFIDKWYNVAKTVILSWIGNHPAETIIIAFFVILTALMIHAYVTTMPPKGIRITYDETVDGVDIYITNNTKSDLNNAYLQVNWIKPEPKPAWIENDIDPVKMFFGASPPKPHNPISLIWETKGDYQHRTKIESTKSAKSPSVFIEEIGRAGFRIEPIVDQFSRTLLKASTKPPLVYFDEGQIHAEIQFGGTNADNEVKRAGTVASYQPI